MTFTEKAIDKPDCKHGLIGTALFKERRLDKDILKTMDEDTFEELVTSWAYWCLKIGEKTKYEDVLRLGGSGDGGVDVIAYYDMAKRDCDIYQCKHYDHPVGRIDVIAEFGKFLYHVSTGDICAPRTYYLVTPQGISGPFNKIYSDSSKLKDEIKNSWDKDISEKIVAKKKIVLEGKLADFVDEFDYTKFKLVSPDWLIKEVHQKENRHVYFQYFGFRKEDLERIDLKTPEKHDEYEKKYIQYLVDAYNDFKGCDDLTPDNVGLSEFAKHLEMSRDEFWMAESVRKMSEENCPGDTDEFAELERDMLHHVIDTYEDDYSNALDRVKAVTKQSTSMPKKENRIISGELGPGELKGVCFQLSNEDELVWKKK